MTIELKYRYQYAMRHISRMRVIMSINSVNEANVSSRSIEVTPAHIHSFGMQFVTPLDLPLHGRYTILLELSSGQYRREITAVVVWKRQAKDGYLYGCSFQGGQRLHMSVRRSWEEERAGWAAASSTTMYDKNGIIRDYDSRHGSVVDVTG